MKIIDILKRVGLFPVFIILIPTVLTLLWFKDGNIMGTGESALPFYDLQIAYNSIKDSWAYYALGYPINIGAAAIPSYWLFAQIQNMGIPPVLLQALFLWVVMIISGFSIYKLTKEVFPYTTGFQNFLAVLFYWFNPFSLVNVWNRFLNNYFVFYALLPATAYLMIKGLKDRNYIFAILVGLVSAALAYALTSMAFILLLWGTIFFIGIFYFLLNKRERAFAVKFIFFSLIFWCLVNFWWLYQLFSYLQSGSFNEVANTSFKTDTNYNTFFLISQKLGILIDIYRLKHAEFFNDVIHFYWVKLYLFPVVAFIEFLVAGIFLLPLIVKKRNCFVFIFSGLLLASLFLAKGNNPPLGELFDRAFLKFSLLQLFRNPFEKIGFILGFSAAVLFAAGCFEVERLLGGLKEKIFRILICLFLLLIWGFPFWRGYVFTSAEAPSNELKTGFRVKVPSVYKEISDWLASQKGNFRLVVLPIGGEGITNTWEKGYSGVELTNLLLSKTSVSFNTNIPFYDDISNVLSRLILTREGSLKIMSLLNSKYILVRKDIDWKSRNMSDPGIVTAKIEKLASAGGLKKVKEKENLVLWEDAGWKDRSIYVTNNLVRSKQASPIEDILDMETSQPLALYSSETIKDDELTKVEIVHPSFKFSIGEQRVESSIILRDDIVFPATNIMPSSFLYPFIKIKEKLEVASISDRNAQIIKKISLLGKRLVEADKEAGRGSFDGANQALDDYTGQLKELYAYQLGDNPNKTDKAIKQEELYKVFSKHYSYMDRINSLLSADKKIKLMEVQALLKNFLFDNGIEPVFGYLSEEDYPLAKREVYQFMVSKKGRYELLLNSVNWNNYFKKSFHEPMHFQIDKNIITRTGELKRDNLISFGFLELSAGKHEIGWDAIEPINLINIPGEIAIKVDHGVLKKTFPINNFDPYSTYVLNINYLVKKGDGVIVSIEGNNDPVKKGIVQPQFRKSLGPDGYNFEEKNYTAYYKPTKTSDSANLIFSVSPWNNCLDIYRTRQKERCKDEKFRRPYDRSTEVVVSDVSLTKVMTEVPFLIMEKDKFSDISSPEVSFRKLNNSEYDVTIKNANSKYALILSELYDPAWVITSQDGVVTASHFLANGYANGWIIDKKGDYKIKVKFAPQDLLEQGKMISVIVLIFGLGCIGIIYVKSRI